MANGRPSASVRLRSPSLRARTRSGRIHARQPGKEASWHEPPHGTVIVHVPGRPGPAEPAGRRTARSPATPRRTSPSSPAEGDAADGATPRRRPGRGAHPGARVRAQDWDISRYTSIPTNVQAPPEKALIDWIFIRTGLAEWHGDNIAVLSANRQKLIAYNSPRSHQAGRRDRRAIHQRHRRHADDPRPVHRRGRPALAVHGLLAADLRRQRPAGAADLDHAVARRRAGALADADPAGVPQARQGSSRDDQRPDLPRQDEGAAHLRRRPPAATRPAG